MVPTVALTAEAVVVYVGTDETTSLRAGDWSGLQRALTRVAATHRTGGRLVLVPDGDVPHGDMIAAMDAARGNGNLFPGVVLAGGVH